MALRLLLLSLTATLTLLAAAGAARAQVAPPPEPSPRPAAAHPEARPGEPKAPTPESDQPRVVAPKSLNGLDVDYPEGAEGEAAVVLALMIDKSGRVVEVSVVQGEPPFAQSAESAAWGWVFTPAMRGGVALESRIQVEARYVPPETMAPDAEPLVAAPSPGQGKELAPELQSMEVVVEDERPIGATRMGRAEVRQLPGAFNDPYRAIELMPGVTPIASGLPYFFVRGAPPGDVGYFFDQVPVPLLFHAAAGPGVIHPAFIESVDLHAGGYPVQYGRFAGGIVEGSLARPKYKRRAELNIRLLDAGAFVESPIAEGRANVMLGGRYSYTGGVISLIASDVSVGYWDYQALASYDASPKDSVSLFAFGSHDYLSAKLGEGEGEQELLDLTFHRMRLRYERSLSSSSRFQVNALLGFERTGAGDTASAKDGGADLNTRTSGLRAQYDARPLSWLSVSAGADFSFSTSSINVSPGEPGGDRSPASSLFDLQERILPVPGLTEGLSLVELIPSRPDVPDGLSSHDDVVSAAWLATSLDLGRLNIVPGFRVDLYRIGELKAVTLEPRVAARYQVTPSVQLVHTLGLAHQPQSFAIPLPGLTVAADKRLQQAFQTSAGIVADLPLQLKGSATVFQNAIVHTSDVFGTTNLKRTTAGVDTAEGRPLSHNYGLELFLRRSLTARFGGALSYTLSRATRSLAYAKGPSSFDRRHVLNLVLAYDLTSSWRLGGRLAMYSGVPAEVAYVEAASAPPLGPWYYRIDWRLEKRWPLGTDGSYVSFVAEVLNTTLNRESLGTSCYAYGCSVQTFGPVTLPSIGFEASF